MKAWSFSTCKLNPFIIAGATPFTYPQLQRRRENRSLFSPTRILKTGLSNSILPVRLPAAPTTRPRSSVGVVFHLQGPTRLECFYVRMTNARPDDQVRRNHTLRYISAPDFPVRAHASRKRRRSTNPMQMLRREYGPDFASLYRACRRSCTSTEPNSPALSSTT